MTVENTNTTPAQPGPGPEVEAALAAEGPMTDSQLESVLTQLSPAALASAGRTERPEQPHRRPSDDARRLYAARHRPTRPAGATDAEEVAWQAVQEAADRVDAAYAQLRATGAEEAAEAKALDAAAVEALRSGKAAKASKATDWEDVRRHRRAAATIALEELEKCRATYDATAIAETPQRKAEALERMQASKAEAERLIGPALAAYDTWRADVAELGDVVKAERPDVAEWSGARGLTSQARELVRSAQGASGAIRASLASQHPVVSGTYFTDPGSASSIPMHAREAIAEGGSEAYIARLAEVEVAEGFTRTSYARAWALAKGMVRPVQRRPMGAA